MYTTPQSYLLFQVNGHKTQPKNSQTFESVEGNQNPSNKLISKYQIRPFGHVGDLVDILCAVYEIITVKRK